VTHSLPSFMTSAPTSMSPALEDDTAAYRPLVGRWLIDLALMLGWDRLGDNERVPSIFRDADFLAITGLDKVAGDDLEQEDRTVSRPSHFARLSRCRCDVSSPRSNGAN
jgi:hypothetical protein